MSLDAKTGSLVRGARRFCLFSLLVFGIEALCAQECMLRDGEHFTYDFSYGKGFCAVSAGRADLDVRSTNCQGRAAFALTMTFKTALLVDAIFHVDARMTSVVEPDLRPLRSIKHAEEQGRVYDESAGFSCPSGNVCVIDAARTVRGQRERKARLTRNGPVYEPVGMIFCARMMDLSNHVPGDKFPFSVATGLHVEEQLLVYAGRETVKGDDGKEVPAYAFTLARKNSKGKETGECAQFWFSADDRRVPVRMDFELMLGTVSARLSMDKSRKDVDADGKKETRDTGCRNGEFHVQ